MTEPDLLVALLSGEQKAVAELYDHYSAAVYGIIFGIVRIDEIAEDLLQDTFVKAWRSIRQYNASKGRLFTWLAQIARNLAIDHIRSKYSRNNRENERIDDLQPKIDVLHNNSFEPHHIGIKTLTSLLLPNHHTLIDLVYFKGFTHKEAAEELRIPVGTVKTRLRLAILALRKQFNELALLTPASISA